MDSLLELNQKIIACKKCPRLRTYCKEIARIKRKAYLKETYWGKPITGFGSVAARLMILGLAPAAHGANRTGRIFTGDRSGEWLYRALFRAGFANQAASTHKEDGLQLIDTYISCIARCAPPDNKPTPQEIDHCSEYLKTELKLLKELQGYIALGQMAFQTLWGHLEKGPRPLFEHGKVISLRNDQFLILSYHPSQQNTFTKRLTEPMFDHVFKTAKRLLSKKYSN